MSLILDALKKSEQERRRERGPDLQTIHQAAPVTARVQGGKWTWLLLLVAINVAAFGGWWWYQQRPVVVDTNKVAANIGAEVANNSVAAEDIATKPSVPTSTPAITTREEPQFTRFEPRQDVSQPRVEANAPIEEFTELAPDVRSALPAMTFSFHVYSTDPLNRTIIINNQRLREGSEVSAGVVLQAITEDGVILTMDHHRIHINVLTGW